MFLPYWFYNNIYWLNRVFNMINLLVGFIFKIDPLVSVYIFKIIVLGSHAMVLRSHSWKFPWDHIWQEPNPYRSPV